VLSLGLAFAFVTVTAVLTATYVVVADGMAGVAKSANSELAKQTMLSLHYEADQITGIAQLRGLRGRRLDGYVEDNFLRGLPRTFHSVGVPFVSVGGEEGGFVVYDESLEPMWYTGQPPMATSGIYRENRLEAQRTGKPVETHTYRRTLLSGLYSEADLGVFVVHVPIMHEGLPKWVIDVVYTPAREEAIIDAIRAPMALLTIAAVVIAVLVTQVSTGWILGLVDDLRRAADSVDAESLDFRLPEYGAHEIGDLSRSLNSLIERLRRRAEAQTRFVADASHELATPVAGIRGYVGILKAWGREDEAVQEEAVGAIDDESRRMVRLCSDLLSLIRSEERADAPLCRYDINALVRQSLASAATRYIDKGLEYVGPEDAELITFGDRDRMDQVLAGLIENASKYTQSGGTVKVETSRTRDGILVEVHDTGVGIPQRDLQLVFERFYRSDASRAKQTGGFGLGLAIAKSLIEGMGCRISVRSVEGESSTFSVLVPERRA